MGEGEGLGLGEGEGEGLGEGLGLGVAGTFTFTVAQLEVALPPGPLKVQRTFQPSISAGTLRIFIFSLPSPPMDTPGNRSGRSLQLQVVLPSGLVAVHS